MDQRRFSRSLDMASACMLLLLLAIQVHASAEAPPKVARCRTQFKANEHFNATVFDFGGVSCGVVLTFPLPSGQTINVTDVRNCDNYYTCSQLSCTQCPCPDGEKFNPVTLKCDASGSACECPIVETTTTSTTAEATTTTTTTSTTATTRITTESVLPVDGIVTSDALNSPQTTKQIKAEPVTTEVIILAGIASGTVLVIVIIVLLVFLWQRGHFNSSKKPAIPPQGNGGYLPTLPVQERHVYAEIDERMVTRNKHWQHGTLAPPVPKTSPPCPSPCPHGHAQTLDYNNSNSSYPKRTFPNTNPNMRYTAPAGPMTGAILPKTGEIDDNYHTREDSSCSGYSAYSNSSNQTSLDSQEIDMHTPLHAGPTDSAAQKNYVSKQVYI